METPKVGDWIGIKGRPVAEMSVGKVFWVGEDRCAATFFIEPNDDGSPSFSDDHDVKINETEVITNAAEIAYFSKLMEKERKLQDLWPECGPVRDRVNELLYKGAEPDADCLSALDEAIEYLSSTHTTPC